MTDHYIHLSFVHVMLAPHSNPPGKVASRPALYLPNKLSVAFQEVLMGVLSWGSRHPSTRKRSRKRKHSSGLDPVIFVPTTRRTLP